MKRSLEGHEVKTVADMKWDGITNGKLLAIAAGQFDAFITVDKNLPRQQNVSRLPMPVIVIHSDSIRWSDVVVHLDKVISLVSTKLEDKLYLIE